MPLGQVIAFDAGRGPPESLKPLLDLVATDMEAINRIILDKAVSDVELIPELAHHLIDSGGKRLRPMLALAAAQAVRVSAAPATSASAAAIEFMHTATLLHDDVVDESGLRRGKQTARMIWGNQASVLVGDFLLGQAFRMLVDVGSLPVLQDPLQRRGGDRRGRGDAARRRQEHGDHRGRVPRHHQRQDGGAVLGRGRGGRRASPTVRRPSRRRSKSYGRNLGLAFQLVDDALDYSGDSASLGKAIGDDFREGKITLPVILSFRRGSEEERQFWKRTIADGEIEGRRPGARRGAHETAQGD